MPLAEAEIVNKLGLHARASAKLTQVASAFASEVWLSRNGRRVNGSSIQIETAGEDEDAAMQAVLALIADRFGEGE